MKSHIINSSINIRLIDQQLKQILMEHNIFSLYDIFEKNSITAEVVWDLNADQMEKMGISVGDHLKYSKAKEKRIVDIKGAFLTFFTTSHILL